jgi:hypothetical protein
MATKITKTTPDKPNNNFDMTEIDYKIYIVRNVDTNDFYISYTKQQYLCRVLGNMKRKKDSLTFTKLFSTKNVKIDLLEIMKCDNLFEVQERINELTEDYKKENKNVYDTKCEYINFEKDTNEEEITKVEKTKKEIIKKPTREDKLCECCNQMVSYSNWARHLKTKFHLNNENK